MIQNEVEDALSDGLLSSQILDNAIVSIDLIEGKLDFKVTGMAEGPVNPVEIKPVPSMMLPPGDGPSAGGGARFEPALS